MLNKLISKKIIILVPIFFLILIIVKAILNYYENKDRLEWFIHEQSKILDAFYNSYVLYHRQLYIDKNINLDEKTIKGFPSFSSYDISKNFSKNNSLAIQIKIVSDRARNNNNKADRYELKALEHFKKDASNRDYFKQERDFYQYAMPLKIEKQCLTCHGDKSKAPKFVSDIYDEAYDYKLGEVRGILSVKTPIDKIDEIFNKQYRISLFYDFMLAGTIFLIALYLARFFSRLQVKLEKEVDKKTIELKDTIQELTNEKYKLKSVIITDQLTKLKNRTALMKEIKKHRQTSIILVNIDDFSQINDFYGHSFGDEVLKQFAKSLQECISEHKDLEVFRISGDEFAISNATLESYEILNIATLMTDLFNSKTFKILDENISLNVTVSASIYPKDKPLICANTALKIAKKESKSFMLYDESMSLDSEYENNMQWTKKIKKAIDNDKVVIFFQPIINNDDNTVNRFETLVRMIDEDEKIISPFFFLNIAKKAKLYKDITKIVIKKSFQASVHNNYEFSINLTIEDILDKEINSYILQMLEQYQNASRIIFEIVESEAIENFDEIQTFIKAIKKLGCRIAIDDFGTGYSNFEYLMKLQADFIKIDGSIIKEIVNDKKAEMITSVIVDFSKKMDIQVIAEFVENENILEKVKSLNIEKSQGYYFSEPKSNLFFTDIEDKNFTLNK